MPLSPQQIRIVINQIELYGTVALAAKHAGIAPSYLAREMRNNEDLRLEIQDAMELFKDGVRMMVMDAAAKGSPVAMKLAAEGFVPETFNTSKEDNGRSKKPTGLTLRQFDDDGNDITPKSMAAGTRTELMLIERLT